MLPMEPGNIKLEGEEYFIRYKALTFASVQYVQNTLFKSHQFSATLTAKNGLGPQTQATVIWIAAVCNRMDFNWYL